MRPPITLTNVDKNGNVTDGKWHVRVGSAWKTINEDTAKAGIEWIQAQLATAGRGNTARPRRRKAPPSRPARKPSAHPASTTSNAS